MTERLALVCVVLLAGGSALGKTPRTSPRLQAALGQHFQQLIDRAVLLDDGQVAYELNGDVWEALVHEEQGKVVVDPNDQARHNARTKVAQEAVEKLGDSDPVQPIGLTSSGRNVQFQTRRHVVLLSLFPGADGQLAIRVVKKQRGLRGLLAVARTVGSVVGELLGSGESPEAPAAK